MIKKVKVNNFKYNKNDDFSIDFEQEFTKKNTFFVGNNGSGKSTILKLIIGVIEGNCHIYNEKKTLKKSEERYNYAINNIFYVPDEVFFENEYIKVKTFIEIKKIKKRNIIPHSLDNTILKELSHGNRKKLYILDALHSEKKILIFDESTCI